ncbi:MAG: DNA mismatch repair protein MutL [Chlamydiae bacterium]|nr:DNA mismatch repair protein MutL [Chlamydiota bacterium]
MATITILNNDTINKIAAGEVVESPVAVIKELVENSLDSRATSIDIEVEKQGFHKIKVQDNGSGISFEDLMLCTKRHATSKIQHVDDLYAISTLGFRGEALAAISSISKLHILTQKNTIGHSAYFEKSELVRHEKKARKQGTTIEVLSLFYNVPVRKNFLNEKTWRFQIEKLIEALSLCYLDVKWSLKMDQKEVLFAPVLKEATLEEKLIHRCQYLFPEEFINGSIFINAKNERFRLHGLITRPNLATKAKKTQLFFVNDRLVNTHLCLDAIKSGYGTMIDAFTYPPFCLFLHTPASFVDVNIHPQKKQVRFKEKGHVDMFLKMHIQKALIKDAKPLFTPSSNTYTNTSSFHLKPAFFETHEQEESMLDIKESVRILHQVEDYALCRHNDDNIGFLFCHLKSALEKKYFDLFQNRQIGSHSLLIPQEFHCHQKDTVFIEKNIPLLKTLGFILEPFGPKVFAVYSFPAFLNDGDINEYLLDLIENLKENKQKLYMENKKIMKRLIGKIQLTHFSKDELEQVVQEMIEKKIALSPFGKPIFYHMGTKELDKLFEKNYETTKKIDRMDARVRS